MKPGIAALLFGGFLVLVHPAWAAPWPSSCGDAQVKFEVTRQARPPAPAPPAAGKAQVIFLENELQPVGPFMHATVRFGLDGSWVGADNGTSYFVADIAPGVHHLCTSWQSSVGSLKKNVQLALFDAAPGKVYYFEARVAPSKYLVLFDLFQLNEDEGKYMVTLAKRATFKVQP